MNSNNCNKYTKTLIHTVHPLQTPTLDQPCIVTARSAPQHLRLSDSEAASGLSLAANERLCVGEGWREWFGQWGRNGG